VLDIIESDVSTLRNRRTARNSKSDVLQILESRRKFGEDQVSIESMVRDVGESRNGQLLVVDSVRHNTEHAGLGKTSGSAGVGSKAEPEAFEVERLDAGARDGSRVSVQRQFAELEEVERAGCSCVLRLGVRDHACETFDRAL
jgi:RecA/RadA recombinase